MINHKSLKNKMKLKTIFILTFALLIVVFSLQNYEVTEIKFLFWTLSVSRGLIILGCFSVGVLVGLIIGMKKSSKKIPNS